MITFGLLVAAATVGTLLGIVLATIAVFALASNKTIMRAYMNWAMKASTKMMEDFKF